MRVIRHADDAVEAFDLGDRSLHRLAGRLIDDVEDLFERLSVWPRTASSRSARVATGFII